MTDVACFCGCVYAFADDVGVCPECGEGVSFTREVGLDEAPTLPKATRMRSRLRHTGSRMPHPTSPSSVPQRRM
jgi:hypothetical protein